MHLCADGRNAKCWQQLLKEKGCKGLKSASVDKTPLSLYWPEKKSSLVMIAAVPHGCYFPPPCCLALLSWRCCFEASVDPVLPLRLSMSSLTHVLLLCVPPSAFGGCPSPPWKEKNNRKKLLHQFWRLNNCPALQKKKSFMSVCW